MPPSHRDALVGPKVWRGSRARLEMPSWVSFTLTERLPPDTAGHHVGGRGPQGWMPRSHSALATLRPPLRMPISNPRIASRLTQLREHFAVVTSLLKDAGKEGDGQTDAGTQGEVWEGPCRVEVCHPTHGRRSPTRKLLEPHEVWFLPPTGSVPQEPHLPPIPSPTPAPLLSLEGASG